MKKNLILAGLAVLAVAACEKNQGPEGGKTPEPKDPAIKAVWACKLSDGGKMDGLHPAIDANGNVYATESNSTKLYKIAPNGTIAWAKAMVPTSESADPFSGQLSAPSVEADGSVIYAGGGSSSNGAYYALNAADGSYKWEFSTDKFWAANGATPAPKINRVNAAIGKECIYIGNGGTTGTALAINKETGARVSYVSSKEDGTGGPAGGCNVGVSLTKGGMALFRAGYGAFSANTSAMDKPGDKAYVTYTAQYRDKGMTQNHGNIACFTKDGKDYFAFCGATSAGMNVIWGPVATEGSLVAYNSDTNPSWTTHSIAGTKAQDQGGLVIGLNGEIIVTLKNNDAVPGGVYAVDPTTNAMAWKYDVGVDLAGTPAVDKAGNVHVIDDYGKYYMLKPNYETKTAELLQSAELSDIYAELNDITWDTETNKERCKAYGTVIIGKDGRMYTSAYFRQDGVSGKPSICSVVFCLESGLCEGAGDTPWPLKNGDCFNSGNQQK